MPADPTVERNECVKAAMRQKETPLNRSGLSVEPRNNRSRIFNTRTDEAPWRKSIKQHSFEL